MNPAANTMAIAIAANARSCPEVSASIGSRPHAERSLRRLVDRVRASGRAGVQGGGVDQDVLGAVDGDREALQAGRRGSELILAGLVVLRAVAGALEPLRLLAVRHAAPEVHAPLVQRHQGDALHEVALAGVV